MMQVAIANQGQDMDQVRNRFQNLHELVAVARANLDRNVWDYLIGGAETETTLRRNRMAIDSLALRPRILRDVNARYFKWTPQAMAEWLVHELVRAGAAVKQGGLLLPRAA